MQRLRQRTKLAAILRSWLPLLSANAEELDSELAKFAASNPAIKIKSSRVQMPPKRNRSNAAAIEALNIAPRERYEELTLQLNKRLFPTESSQAIAQFIIENLDERGYYEEPEQLPWPREQIERVRARFAYLEPAGIGASSYAEAVKFALLEADISDNAYQIACALAADPARASELAKERDFAAARAAIERLCLPPWLDYAPDSSAVVADIIVYNEDDHLQVCVADDEYSQVLIDESLDKKFYAEQLRAASNLIDALELRRATLKKIGLMIIELQYDYFIGGAIVPMKLADIAYELDRNPSTISRAIAGKYLQSPRGLIALKEFFCAAVDDEGTSNRQIKDYLSELIAAEDPKKPLSDAAILSRINEHFKVNLVRRTVTKYRALLGIKGSSERKKIYALRKDYEV